MVLVLFVFLFLVFLVLFKLSNIKVNSDSFEKGEVEVSSTQCENKYYDGQKYVKYPAKPEPLQETELLPRCFVAFDVETTGLDPIEHSIVEIGAVRFLDGVEVGSFRTLVNPERSIPRKATNIHRITQAMVKDKPSNKQALTEFRKWVGEDLLIAHNANFDVRFIKTCSGVFGPKWGTKFGCTLQYSETILGKGGNSLGDLAERFGIPFPTAHSALHDARACGLLALELQKILYKSYETKRQQYENAKRKIDIIDNLAGYSKSLVGENFSFSGIKELSEWMESHSDIFSKGTFLILRKNLLDIQKPEHISHKEEKLKKLLERMVERVRVGHGRNVS